MSDPKHESVSLSESVALDERLDVAVAPAASAPAFERLSELAAQAMREAAADPVGTLDEHCVEDAYVRYGALPAEDRPSFGAFLRAVLPDVMRLYAGEYARAGLDAEAFAAHAQAQVAKVKEVADPAENPWRLKYAVERMRHAAVLDALHGLRALTEKNLMGLFRGGYEGHLRRVNDLVREMLRGTEHERPASSDWSLETEEHLPLRGHAGWEPALVEALRRPTPEAFFHLLWGDMTAAVNAPGAGDAVATIQAVLADYARVAAANGREATARCLENTEVRAEPGGLALWCVPADAAESPLARAIEARW